MHVYSSFCGCRNIYASYNLVVNSRYARTTSVMWSTQKTTYWSWHQMDYGISYPTNRPQKSYNTVSMSLPKMIQCGKCDTAAKSHNPRGNHHANHSKNVLFPRHNHLLPAGTNDSSLAGTQVIIKVSGHQYRWLAGGHDLEIGHF